MECRYLGVYPYCTAGNSQNRPVADFFGLPLALRKAVARGLARL
jgi:hypothetical protein